MNLYDAIYTRRSVRNFRMEPVDKTILESIPAFLEEIVPLFPEIRTEVVVYENITKKEKLSGFSNISAPYYAVIFAEPKEKSDMNAGFIMQQLSLYLTTKGLGSCFMGTVRKKDRKMEEAGMRCVAVLAFGLGKGAIVRRDYEAKRLPMEELCAYKEPPKAWVKEILEVARLAPSSLNSQPWRFVVYENRIHVFSKKPVVSHSALGKYNEFNFGIMFANVLVAADEIWADVDLIKLENINHKTIPNNQYVLSILAKS